MENVPRGRRRGRFAPNRCGPVGGRGPLAPCNPLPAPEAAHAIRVVIDEALRCKASGDRKVIAFNLCGHGHFDLSAYERYMAGKLEDFEYPAEQVKAALAGLPKVKV